MQEWHRTPEVLWAILFGGLAMLAQYLPVSIGVPVGVLLVIVAAYLLWNARQPKQQRLIIRLPIKRVVDYTFIAVAILAIIFIGYGIVNKDGESTLTLLPDSSQEWQWSHPSPWEIMENIDALLPYLQENARQKYEGLLVTWGVRLVSITEKTSGTYIQTYSLEEHQELVTFTIDISEYPQLTIVEEGQEFVVRGIIANVNTISIELDDCRLIFD